VQDKLRDEGRTALAVMEHGSIAAALGAPLLG